MAGAAGPAAAETQPSPSESAPPASPGPSESASPSTGPGGNAPPEFLQCPAQFAQAGVPESFGLQVEDPEGDEITLTVTSASAGVVTSIQGRTLTYTAPEDQIGEDYLAVTAEDGHGGSDVCDMTIHVDAPPDPTPTPEPTSPAPSPSSPTDTPSTSPTQEPTSPGPSPSSSPAPSQGPTSGPAPTAEPSPAPTGGDPGESSPTTAPSGDGGGSASGTPGTTGPSGGRDGGPTGGAEGGGDNGDGQSPQDGTTPSGSAPGTPGTTAQRLRDLTRETTVSCSLQAVEDARTLLEGLSAGMASRPGGGDFPEAGSGENGGNGDQDAAPTQDPEGTAEATGDRTAAVTGSSMWLFAGMGVLMVVLIGLAAAALPRGGRRH